jgi:hypothetical protein
MVADILFIPFDNQASILAVDITLCPFQSNDAYLYILEVLKIKVKCLIDNILIELSVSEVVVF